MRRRIVLVSAATTILVLVAYLVPLIVLVRQVAETRAIAAARASADTMATVLLSVDSREEAQIGVDAVNAHGLLSTTVFYTDGAQAGAPARADDYVRLTRSQRVSFDSAVPGGRALYLPVDVGDDPCCIVVRTFIPNSQLQAGVMPASNVLTGLAVLLLLTSLLVALWLSRSLVKPLLDVAAEARALHEGDLTRRARPGGPPEIAAIATALNRLATRVDELLQAERETVADLSHRVRTPLTALRLNIESLRDPEDVHRLSPDVDHVEEAVSQVIAHTRTPRGRSASATSSLTGLLRARVTFWSVLAKAQGRTVETDIADQDVVVPVREDELEAVIDALIGNVLAHTPAGTPFSLAVGAGPPARLIVRDSGPGLTEPALLERGHSGGGSTGLGLDIVRRTAENAGGGLEVTSGPYGRGLTAVVTFGQPQPHGGQDPPRVRSEVDGMPIQ
jgi:signal transduction histidine kinase